MRKLIPFTFVLIALPLCISSAFAQSKVQPNPARQVKVAISQHSTMATSQLLKGFTEDCPNVSIILDESVADYVIDANGPNAAEGMKHYRITLFSKQGTAVFATDKHFPGAATKEVCRFINDQQ